MSKIFLIAGLGADTRIYNHINLNDHDVVCIDWIEPHQTDTLKTYAQRLIFQYDITPYAIVIGNSLGGMIAIEIGKILPLQKTILISSIKTIDEAPWYFSLFQTLPVYKLIPGKLFTSLGFLMKPLFGKMHREDAWLFSDMLKKSSPVFIKWAMDAVLQWNNKTIPANTFHITGDKDRIFPYQRIKNAVVIKGGTHIMIFDKANEVNKILKGILKK
jgi:pimeloyl-ACP methyl ester carboxylesterase